MNPRWALLFSLFFAASLVLVLANFNRSDPASARHDYLYHHLPGTIDYSQPGGPHKVYAPNIPGYYVVMGAVRRWITASVVGLRPANLLFTAGLALTLCISVARKLPSAWGPWLAAPFLFSEAVFTRGIWPGTDNPPWWGVLAISADCTSRQFSGGSSGGVRRNCLRHGRYPAESALDCCVSRSLSSSRGVPQPL